MNARPDRVSDGRTLVAVSLLILTRLILAMGSSFLLASFVYQTTLGRARIVAFLMISLSGILAAGALLRRYRDLPGLVFNGLGVGAVLFLGLAAHRRIQGNPARSVAGEIGAVLLCCLFVTAAVAPDFLSRRQKQTSRRRRKAKIPRRAPAANANEDGCAAPED